jgi:hypothetical protein
LRYISGHNRGPERGLQIRGKWWARATAALVATATLCAPLALAATRTGAKPNPGSLFVGAPRGFGSDEMHWRVASNGKAMTLVGFFGWRYGCSRPFHNYWISDQATLKQPSNRMLLMFVAPTVVIRGSSFSASSELQRQGHRYGRFKIYGTFTSPRSAKTTFSFANLPHCGTLTFKFKLQGS